MFILEHLGQVWATLLQDAAYGTAVLILGGWVKWDIGLGGVFVVGGCKEGVEVVGPVYLASGEWVWVGG